MGSFKARMKGPPLILLSFCDGIGSSMLALEWIWGTPRLSLAWEIDEECNLVTQHWFPDLVNRGCFMYNDDYDEVVK